MDPVRQRGTLVEWNDDRGFGFIQLASSSQKVFLHINDLRRGVRRPQVGDTIYFDLATRADGKTRATYAYLLGIPPQETKKTHASSPYLDRRWVNFVATGLAFLVAAGAVLFGTCNRRNHTSQHNDAPQTSSLQPPGYTIKGNISLTEGRRLYHYPGCEDYEMTIIDLERGERWFRTIEEARSSGWVDAHR